MRSASRSGAKKSLRTIPIIIIVTIILASISGATAAVISYGDSIWPALEGSVFSTIGSNGTSTAPKGRSTSTKARFAKIRAGDGFLEASVTTDQQDYAPGQVVNISGSGFAPGESVSLQVTYVAGYVDL